MGFSDLFVPKYLHSNPKVRIKFVSKTTDLKLLEQMVEQDEDDDVVHAARERIQALTVTHTV
ncbi:hypothetical protein [Desulfospira joergensenii]|uniref:hypothetical protein n=1 Tax=Desulfospira joergensenii TaxID=53329 RepID=UPI0003B4F7FB|nr:hypothetical protein [Desulfospira joergensenii]